MKVFRILALLLVFTLCLGVFAGCGEEKKKDDADSSVSQKGEASAEESAEGSASKEEQSDIEGDLNSDDVSHVESEDNSDSDESKPNVNVNTDKPVPTIVAKDNGNGTVTVTAKLPSGIGNGLIVITVSDELIYVDGSAKSSIGSLNDNGAFNGVGVSFATATLFDEGTEVITLDYKLAEGATLSDDDFWCDRWELGDGTKWLSKKGEDGCTELKFVR